MKNHPKRILVEPAGSNRPSWKRIPKRCAPIHYGSVCHPILTDRMEV